MALQPAVKLWCPKLLSQNGIQNDETEQFSSAYTPCENREKSSYKTYYNCLLVSILLLADRGGLKDAHAVEALQEQFLECLRREISRREEHDHHLFAKLLMKMPLLRSISTVQQENTLCFRMENPEVTLPLLLVELNDLTSINEQTLASNGPPM